MSYVVLLLGLLFAVWARSVVRRRSLWVSAMVGAELGLWPFFAAVGLAWWSVAAGGSDGTVGKLGLMLLLVASAGFGVSVVRSLGAPRSAREAVAGFGATAAPSGSPWVGLVLPIAVRPRRVQIAPGVRYGPHERHLLDHTAALSTTSPRPALVYVHGGGWWRGRRNTQARPMVYRLAKAGWHVFCPSYRLSPEVKHPAHLIDVKRAIAWIRANAGELGVDPTFIAVAGGSTGGNLAALAALTSTERDLQPGFEDADASVQACVPLYGVHDMLREDGRPLWPYLETTVMQSTPREDPEAWRAASPVRLAGRGHPPFFVIHGAADTLVDAELSRRLAGSLRDAGGHEVGYLEVPWANHGYDFFAGIRGRATASAVTTVLEHLWQRESVK